MCSLVQLNNDNEETLEIKHLRSSIPEQVEVFEYYDQFLFEPNNISFETHQTPHIFTEFRKKVEKYGLIEKEVYPDKKSSSNLIKEETKFVFHFPVTKRQKIKLFLLIHLY